MTTSSYLDHEAKAARLQKEFSDACVALEAIIRRFDGVTPKNNPAVDEEVFKATSAMISSVQAIHHAIRDTHAEPLINTMHRGTCRMMHKQVQAVLSAPYGHTISLGFFHDNLWELAKSFFNPLDMSKVEPSVAMKTQQAQVDKQASNDVAGKRPVRPAGKAKPRNSQGQRSHTSRDAAPQFT